MISVILMLVIILLVLAAARWRSGGAWAQIFRSKLFIICLAGLLVRLFCVLIPAEHPNDFNNFAAWADMLFSDGLGSFYSSDSYVGIPPGYLYVLYIIGALRSVFRLATVSFASNLLLKLPSIFADMAITALLFTWAKRRSDERRAMQVAVFYCFNPAVILISSVWGQIDAIYTLALLGSVYFLSERRTMPAMVLWSVACFVELNCLIFVPLYIYYICTSLSGSENTGKELLDIIESLVASVLVLALLIIPICSFSGGRPDLSPLLEQYKNIYSLKYATVNAYNIYALFGQNWTEVGSGILGTGITYRMLGFILGIVSAVAALLLLVKRCAKSNYFFTGAVLSIAIFMLTCGSSERNVYPALALLLAAFVFKNDKRVKFLYYGASVAFLANCADVLAMSNNDYNYEQITYSAIIYAVLWLAVFIYLIYTCIVAYTPEEIAAEQDGGNGLDFMLKVRMRPRRFRIEKTQNAPRFDFKDFVAVAAITLVYAFVAFFNLGNTQAAQNYYYSEKGSPVIIIEFESPTQLTRVQNYLGPRNDRSYTLEFSDDGEQWHGEVEIDIKSVFSWAESELDVTARYVRMTITSDDFYLMEMAFCDANDEIVPILSVSEGADALFDEQDMVPQQRDYMNSSYFDEVYHPRTAYEFVEDIKVYEWTHPPLGKVIMSLGVRAFGMTPFGWRFTGTLCGVLMLPLLYCFARRLLKERFWAVFATALFAFDFMHYTQTRLATIDSYTTFFVIGMFYYMYKYYRMSFYDTPLRKTLVPLFFSGLFMGLGIATKWQGVYAGVGLAVIFFITMVKRWREYRHAKQNGIEGNYDKFWRLATITCLCCVLFFIIIPLIIYVLSYIPYYFGEHTGLYPIRANNPLFEDFPFLSTLIPDTEIGNFLAAVIRTQQDMFKYHSQLESTHPYSAKWYQWIVNWRPIYYFSATVDGDIRQGISSFGNPALWWGGIVAVFTTVYAWLKKYRKEALFLIIAYLAQLLPWVLVPRTTYIYHYFPCVPFLALMVAYVFREFVPKAKRKYTLIYLAVAAGLFVMFYPAISGMPVNYKYVKYLLEWLPRWHLIS